MTAVQAGDATAKLQLYALTKVCSHAWPKAPHFDSASASISSGGKDLLCSHKAAGGDTLALLKQVEGLL